MIITVARVTFHHLVCWLEASIGDFGYTELFMVCFLSRYDWSISHKREVNSWVWHQISLEFSEIHVKCSIETKRGSDG